MRNAGLGPDDASVVILAPGGEKLVSILGGEWLKPASNLKVVTTIAALELLGPDYEFVTQLRAKAPMVRGAIEGDVVLWGTGDPNISGRFFDGDPTRLLRDWGRGLAKKGLTRIRGRLLVDDSFFDDERFPSTWKPIHRGRPFAAEVSSLNLSDNCVEVGIWPSRPGLPAKVLLTPDSDFVSVRGAPRTVAAGKPSVTIHRPVDSNVLEIGGRVPVRLERWFDNVAVSDPALFFGHSLVGVLRETGIDVEGAVERLAPDAAPEADPDDELASKGERPAELERDEEEPGGGEPRRFSREPRATGFDVILVEHRSSLATDVRVVNKESQNLHAEILLKSIGARIEGEGSIAAGARAEKELLERWGADTSGLVIVDGSGLSHDNRLSTDILSRCLDRARKRPWFEVFFGSLAVGGEDGTLDDRFRQFPRLEGRVHAKSGFIDSVSALSGYLVAGEETWVFSMLFRRLPGGNPAIKLCQERIIAALDASIGGS